MVPTVLFIHIGRELPPWLGPVLHQARLFNTCPIILLAEARALAQARLPASLELTAIALEEIGESERQRQFRTVSRLDTQFLSGFWTHASERFFVLESAIERLSLEQIVHVENDVMLYCSFDELIGPLAHLYEGVAATFDNDVRCVPGIVYFPSQRSARLLTEFFVKWLSRVAKSPKAHLASDMAVLGAFRALGPRAVDYLPIIPPDYPAPLRSAAGHSVRDPACYSRNFETLGMLFDAAALGQFLGGVDPRSRSGPTAGFVNESCIFDPRVLQPRLMRDSRGRRVPIVETMSGIHRVANLHIHSKDTARFSSL